MEISKESLLRESEELGFNSQILEKVWCLMEILSEISMHPFLKDRLVLKGGTALNLFVLDLPRLSVDIDLNYVGAQDREEMLKERPQVEKALESVFQKKRLHVRRIPDKHAGGKWRLQYKSVLPYSGTLEIDLNFMFRIPLWEIQKSSSKPVGSRQVTGIPILDVHELAAGKLSAFFSRRASRDLFDVHHLLTQLSLDQEKLRFTFLLYAAMGGLKLEEISLESLGFELQELKMKLVPVLKLSTFQKSPDWSTWPQTILTECKNKLSFLWPFRDNEKEFFDLLHQEGKIDAALLTEDKQMIAKIEQLPLLRWRAQLASKYKT